MLYAMKCQGFYITRTERLLTAVRNDMIAPWYFAYLLFLRSQRTQLNVINFDMKSLKYIINLSVMNELEAYLIKDD